MLESPIPDTLLFVEEKVEATTRKPNQSWRIDDGDPKEYGGRG
jgi:hypothetical protein